MAKSEHLQASASVPAPLPDPARRSAMKRFGWKAMAGLATAVAAAASTSETAEAQSLTDTNILNFALKLEYLEAEFYLRAATGQGLSASLTTGFFPNGANGSITS